MILKTNSKDGSNLQLIWLRLLVWTHNILEPQSVGVVLGITSLVLTVRVTTVDQLKFSLLPSVCLSEHFNLDTSAEELIKHFGDDLQCKVSAIFRSELKRLVKQWRVEMENRRAEYSATATKTK